MMIGPRTCRPLYPGDNGADWAGGAGRCLWRTGIDFLDQLKSYTFDYRTMKFGVRTE